MATIVGEAFVAVTVEALLKSIVSGDFVDFFRSTKLDDSLLMRLNTTLLCLQALLNDAEEKQIKNDAVKQWLVLLQDAVFEAEDLFDEINTEALRRKVEAGKTVSAKVRKFLSSRSKRFYRAINSKMQTLFEKLDHFSNKGHLLGLKEGVSSGNVWQGPPTSSVVDESSVYGRDGDVKKLKDFLLSEDAGGCKIGVISIVGMGGLGKTTLAKLLYNDPEVEDKFDLKGWACISQDFDVLKVTKTLCESINLKTMSNGKLNFESVNSKANHTSDLNTLQVELQQRLGSKKFLLVLDDIWYGNNLNWNNLIDDIFNVGEMGSKIIITTRDKRVAEARKTFLPIHYLEPLESEDCWSLLAKHAFKASNYQQQSNLEVIGKEIANKCKGLPLAAAALGCLLGINLSQDYWKGVSESNIWEKTTDDVQPALLLSYRCLPTPLKGCFAYCSLFPKNSILEKTRVVRFWIAEGLVVQPRDGKCWEKVGEGYFDELVSRSLIRRQQIDGKECFEMHDLMNDLATTISSSYCISLDEQKQDESIERVRYLSYNRGEYDTYNKFEKMCRLKGLRSFMALPFVNTSEWIFFGLQDKVVHDFVPAMKRLRVLSLSHYITIKVLPKTIGNLIYLRYLDLSGTRIKRLPSETCKLHNLQTLLLLECYRLSELPEDMGKLVNLRHLDIRGTALREMPVPIATLENLQTLSDFVVSDRRDGLNVVELTKFPHLQGKLSISKLQNVTGPSDAFRANLMAKEQIDDLVLKWSNPSASDSQIQNLVLEQLRPPTNLKKLAIQGYGGNNFPKWLEDSSSFGNLVYLKISNCHNCSWLPPLGQLCNLKELYIDEMDSVKSIGAEFYGSGSGPSFQPFPSLETLSFQEMREWEELNLIGFGGTTATKFPSLRCLSLQSCMKLKGDNILDNLPSLTEFELRECPLLVESGQLMLHQLSSLQKLTIEDFPSLMSFPTGGLPKTLQFLTIKRCENLEFLQHESFPTGGLPKTLQSLTIEKCENLEFLPQESLHNYTSLEHLEIYNSFNSMTSFSLGSLPVLKSLFIWGCKNLKSILIGEDASKQSLSFLQSIRIYDCEELESFSHKGGSGLPTPNLIQFDVSFCKKLRSLPGPLNALSELHELVIRLDPFSISIDDLPISLRRLTIVGVGGISWNAATWERFTCLSYLAIKCNADTLKALMKTEMSLLPASLVWLWIWDLDDVESLDGKWLQHLTSLQELYISNGPNLKSLPEEGLLPSSLSILFIDDCPLLKAILRRKRGKEWRKIAHIPFVCIDKKRIT